MKHHFFVLFFLLVHGLLEAGISKDESDTLSTIYLNNEVIISAQRYNTEVFDRPESVGYLAKTQLDRLSPMSMPQTLSFIPGVWMQKTNHGGGSAFVRGLTGYQTLLMIDGIRMNNSTYRSGPNQYLNTIDPLMISHVEVLRGSGSVQYGSDAIGGTIQVLSKDPSFSNGGVQVSGSIYGKYWSSDMEKTGRAELSIGTKKFALIGGFTYKDLGNIHAGGDLGILDPTGYDEYAMDVKGRYQFNDNHHITAAYQRMKQIEVPLYHKVAPGDYQIYQFNPQQRDLAYLKLGSYYQNKFFSEIRYSVSYQNALEVREKQKAGSVHFVREEDDVKTVGAGVEVISKIKEKWKASSGVEFYHDLVGSNAESTNQETNESTSLRGLYPDGSTYNNFAVYSLHSYDLKRWNFSMGLRYNFIGLYVEDTTFGNTTVTPSALVGNAGVVYKLSQNHHLTATINSSFRAPNINDVSSFGIADFRYEVPAYDLKPETACNKELGYKMKYDRISAAFHIFHNKLNDLIANVPGDFSGMDSLDGYKVYKRENVNEAAIFGGEAEFEAELTKTIAGFGNVSYTYGENISNDEPMRRIPPLNGRLGMRAMFKSNISMRAEWIFSAEQTRLSSGDIADDRIEAGGTPGWNVVNIYGGYDHKYFTVNASLQNLFNTAYRMHGSGVDGIGRSFWVSLLIKINPQ